MLFFIAEIEIVSSERIIIPIHYMPIVHLEVKWSANIELSLGLKAAHLFFFIAKNVVGIKYLAIDTTCDELDIRYSFIG